MPTGGCMGTVTMWDRRANLLGRNKTDWSEQILFFPWLFGAAGPGMARTSHGLAHGGMADIWPSPGVSSPAYVLRRKVKKWGFELLAEMLTVLQPLPQGAFCKWTEAGGACPKDQRVCADGEGKKVQEDQTDQNFYGNSEKLFSTATRRLEKLNPKPGKLRQFQFGFQAWNSN
ncbi:hypothetical protein Q9966_006115 [Columba livia]|nr:hypothetical protein Q9966_006115 [Columba livia]